MSSNNQLKAMTASVNMATEGVKNTNRAINQVVSGANNLSNNRVAAATANAKSATKNYNNAGNNFKKAANVLTPYSNAKGGNLSMAARALKNASRAAALAQGAKAIAYAVKAVEQIGENGNRQFPKLTRNNSNFGPRTPNR
jgi:polyribonucleotide nucleotidyltransferase